MLKFSLSVRDIDFNEAADRFLPNEFKSLFIKAGIRILPAKEQITAFVVNTNKDRFIRDINKGMEKKSLPLKINLIRVKHF